MCSRHVVLLLIYWNKDRPTTVPQKWCINRDEWVAWNLRFKTSGQSIILSGPNILRGKKKRIREIHFPKRMQIHFMLLQLKKCTTTFVSFEANSLKKARHMSYVCVGRYRPKILMNRVRNYIKVNWKKIISYL